MGKFWTALCMFYFFHTRPTSEFPHPLSRVKQQAGYRVSLLIYFLLLSFIFPPQFFCSFTTFSSYVAISLLAPCFPPPFQLSYQIVDSLIWLGIRDMINDVRKKKLKLRPVTYLSGSQGSDSDIPHGYIWSPHLVPKPKGGCFWIQSCFILLPII